MQSSPELLFAQHPELALGCRACLAGLQLLERRPTRPPVGSQMDTSTAMTIMREAGRGGMGIVYEAVQTATGRRVALKVLPFAATLDSRQLQRFQNEAHAAANLHHPHIVPVYDVLSSGRSISTRCSLSTGASLAARAAHQAA